MAQYQINVDSNILQQLFIGDRKDAGVAKLLESVVNQVLQAQVTEQLDAERYERAEERKGYRNGTYPHKLTTRVGTLTLHIPRIRDGKFSTNLFARYQRSEQAFVGDGCQWCLYSQGVADYRGTVWRRILKVYGERVM
ncbi:hypothetical protein PMJ10TS2_64390 [Paenibacillus melissococcoides]